MRTRPSLFLGRPDRFRELGHGGVVVVADPLTPEQLAHGRGDDPAVERQRLRSPHVEREPIVPGDVVPTIHLRPTGDTRAYLEPAAPMS
jgi:hypothetical protein